MGETVGPWPLGMDMVSEITSLQEGAALDITNGYITMGGDFIRRDGETVILPDHIHSAWEATDGTIYAVSAGQLGTLDYDGVTVTFTALFEMPDDSPVSFTEVNDQVVFSSWNFIGLVSDEIRQIGVELPGAFKTFVMPDGPLQAGTYGVAIGFVSVDGEEGGLSDVTFVTLPGASAIGVELPPAIEARTASVRVYCTQPNGEILYRYGEYAPGSTLLINTPADGPAASTQFLSRLTPGRYARYWRGRLLTARGHVLSISEPLRYGLVDSRHGWVMFPETIRWIEALPEGVYVGTDKVYFLAGNKPADWVKTVADRDPPLGNASIVLPIAKFAVDEKLFPQGTNYVVVWLSSGGFYFGLPSGDVVRPQNDRIDIDLASLSGALYEVDGVLTAILD